ncbi:glycosyltransferase domain-containing protein [Aestuariivivens sediminicola]|uniref:glycosyltransferase domain-containing protein n=1 Tax=Aestuariivivens sediminicola TaxID=2913560 RepID=UPI001F562FA8|nr:glycosyltransferase domain-containing protein [Aestuariivivens sediminicola]
MKIAIYTANFGGKDALLTPLNYLDGSDISFYLFTDTDLNVYPYETVIKPLIFKDVSKNAFYYKHMGDPILKDYDVLIWHDSNIQLDFDKLPKLIEFAHNSFLTMYVHPDRDDFYSEAMTSVRIGKDFSLRILKQALIYFFNGMPAHAGMYASGILIKNQNIDSGNFYPFWWKQTLKYSRRDQLSIVYVIHKTGQKINTIKGNVFKNIYSIYHAHKYEYYIESKDIMRYNYSILKKFSFYAIKVLRKLRKMIQ